MLKFFQARDSKNILGPTVFAWVYLKMTRILHLLRTTYIQHGLRKAFSFSMSQGIPRLLRNPKFHCRVNKNPLLLPILRKTNPVHALLSSFSKIHIDIIFPSMYFKLCYLRSAFQNRLRVKETVQGWMEYIKIQKDVDISTNVKMALLFLINVQKVSNSMTIQNYVV